ncbi:9889_t:CDS:2, partial [Dentiscutata erythropus]
SEDTNNTIYKSNDPEVLSPDKDGVENNNQPVTQNNDNQRHTCTSKQKLHSYYRHYVYHLAFLVILLPSLIFIVFTIIEIIYSAYYEVEITELKVLEERVEVLEKRVEVLVPNESRASKPNESQESNSSQPKAKCKQFFVDLHNNTTNRRMLVYLTCVAIYVTLTEKLEEKVFLLLEKNQDQDQKDTNSTIYEPNDPEVSNSTSYHHYVNHIAYYVVLIPSLIFILFTVIEVICAAIYDIDEISELKDLEERVKALEPKPKPIECNTSEYGKYMKYVVGFHDRIKNRRIM